MRFMMAGAIAAVFLTACGSTASPGPGAPGRSPTPVESPAAAPPAAAPPAAAALAVHITSSTYGQVSATTTAGASCTAQATLPSGGMSTAAGLQVPQTAGASGAVSWTYRTSGNTHKGTGTHTVTCSLSGQSASDGAPFTVS
jgi:hypothetical protein